jgi:hypothetical protein
MYDIDNQFYLVRDVRESFVRDFGMRNIPHIFLLDYTFTKAEELTVDLCLSLAEGKSLLNSTVEREGVVFKCKDNGALTFKTISNRWLLKTGN